MATPFVSAVIPTRNRHQLVLRAVHSVLTQTYENLEAIVVIDGPDSVTRSALGAIVDPRLRVVELEHSVGGSDARNRGVREARGEWVALLDDDDEWLPSKIEKQVDVAVHSKFTSPIVPATSSAGCLLATTFGLAELRGRMKHSANISSSTTAFSAARHSFKRHCSSPGVSFSKRYRSPAGCGGIRTPTGTFGLPM